MQISAFPGALKFRLVVMVILIVIFLFVFLNYSNKISIETERASIQQTKNIVNSTLAVIFAKYAVEGDLNRLNQLNGSNPFKLLDDYNLLPTTYQGETEADGRLSGWYYDQVNGLAVYKSFHDNKIYRFKIVFDFHDVNKSGQYEADVDGFRRLEFMTLPQQ